VDRVVVEEPRSLEGGGGGGGGGDLKLRSSFKKKLKFTHRLNFFLGAPRFNFNIKPSPPTPWRLGLESQSHVTCHTVTLCQYSLVPELVVVVVVQASTKYYYYYY
jgi:hypothetical protein